MSIINQTLRELDARRAAPAAPFPASAGATGRRRPGRWALAALLVPIVGAAAWFAWSTLGKAPPAPPHAARPSLPAPVVVGPAVAPASASTAPVAAPASPVTPPTTAAPAPATADMLAVNPPRAPWPVPEAATPPARVA